MKTPTPAAEAMTDSEYLLAMIDETFANVPEIRRHHERIRSIAAKLAAAPVAWVGAEAIERLSHGHDVHSARLWAKPHPADVALYTRPAPSFGPAAAEALTKLLASASGKTKP